MTTIGLDLHKRESQLCIAADDGTIQKRRIVTSRDRFTAVLGGLVPVRVLLEARARSERVARHLESLGHEVIVADANFAPMCTACYRRVKTDRRDVYTLMKANDLAIRQRRNGHAASQSSGQRKRRTATLDPDYHHGTDSASTMSRRASTREHRSQRSRSGSTCRS